jgi:hypothetical protein
MTLHYLAEDPWPLVIVLGMVAFGFLVALRVTQQGKHLLRAIICVALAMAIWTLERFWVTDNERIEKVVYELGHHAERSDVDALFRLLTPDVSFSSASTTLKGPFARAFVSANLKATHFDFVRISRVDAEAYPLSRTGKAEFRVHTGGTWAHYNFLTGPEGSDWSVGLQELPDHQWKINRITATRLPGNFQLPLDRVVPID